MTMRYTRANERMRGESRAGGRAVANTMRHTLASHTKSSTICTKASSNETATGWGKNACSSLSNFIYVRCVCMRMSGMWRIVRNRQMKMWGNNHDNKAQEKKKKRTKPKGRKLNREVSRMWRNDSESASEKSGNEKLREKKTVENLKIV